MQVFMNENDESGILAAAGFHSEHYSERNEQHRPNSSQGCLDERFLFKLFLGTIEYSAFKNKYTRKKSNDSLPFSIPRRNFVKPS